MRIPKYRAWHRKDKKMYPVCRLNWIENWQFQEIPSVMIPDNRANYPHYIPGKDIDLMESVGIKDRTGKEIFDGDIVKTYGTDMEILQVYFNQSVAMFCLKRQTSNGTSYTGFHYYRGSQMEVIGNIYDNPDMLTDA